MLTDLPDSVRTVSQITLEIKLMLENTYRFAAVSGEISNLRTPFSGHHYFTLKDSNAQLRAVMFKGQQRYLAEPLRDGQQVICRGRISVYEPRGEYQLIVDTVDQHGLGVLQMKFAALKTKLAEEGLFDVSRKKMIPEFPRKIVVISSPTGAAVQDFLKICSQRKTPAHIQIFPVPVQGDTAAREIARAIDYVNRNIACDLIVLCRGGGSLEDLWAFNEEVVARAVSTSKLPIVTGIGHEIDTTIADLCSDLRAPTPTGAAEIVIPDTRQLLRQLQSTRDRLKRTILQQLNTANARLSHQKRLLTGYKNTIENLALRIDLATDRLQQAQLRDYNERRRNLQLLISRLQHQAPLARVSYQEQAVAHLRKTLITRIKTIIEKHDERLSRSAALLHSVSPLSTLARGYSIVRRVDPITGEKETVSASSQVTKGDQLDILLHKGRVECEVQRAVSDGE